MISGHFLLRSGDREKTSKSGVFRRNREIWQVYLLVGWNVTVLAFFSSQFIFLEYGQFVRSAWLFSSRFTHSLRICRIKSVEYAWLQRNVTARILFLFNALLRASASSLQIKSLWFKVQLSWSTEWERVLLTRMLQWRARQDVEVVYPLPYAGWRRWSAIYCQCKGG